MQVQTHFIELSAGFRGALHHFSPAKGKIKGVVFLVHGSIEDSRIFFSKSGKGLAPFLAREGYEVFCADLRGRGKSTPAVSKQWDQTQHDCILNDLPKFIDYARPESNDVPFFLGAHSWGGVLLLAWWARFGQDYPIAGFIFFGVKRRLKVNSLRKFLVVRLVWQLVGETATRLAGFFPARQLKMGSQNEPRSIYRDTSRWVNSKNWTDHIDSFDYQKTYREKGASLPPSMWFAGYKDHVLGHPLDVQRTVEETHSPDTEFILLGKHCGHLHDYNHINMLTHPEAPEDHFQVMLKWLHSQIVIQPQNQTSL